MAILTLNPTVVADADGTVKFGSGEKNQNVRRRDISEDGADITPIQVGVAGQRHVITGGRVSVSGPGSIDIYSGTTLRDRIEFIAAATATFPVGWEAGEEEDLAIRNPDGLTVTGWIEWVTVKNGEYSPATEGASGREAVQDMTVPTADSVANILTRDVVGNKSDAASSTADTSSVIALLRQALASASTIDGFFDVPTADAVTNTTMRDVLGNKEDAANETASQASVVGLLRQALAEITTIDGFFDVPNADVGTNATMRDVIGNKTDTHDGDSIRAMSHRLDEHAHKESMVYPTLADGVTVTATVNDWTDLGAFVEVVPINTITSDFDIHFVNVESVSANGIYELVLYAEEVEIARARFGKTTNQDGPTQVMIQTPIIHANTQIQAKLASDDMVADTATISLELHKY